MVHLGVICVVQANWPWNLWQFFKHIRESSTPVGRVISRGRVIMPGKQHGHLLVMVFQLLNQFYQAIMSTPNHPEPTGHTGPPCNDPPPLHSCHPTCLVPREQAKTSAKRFFGPRQKNQITQGLNDMIVVYIWFLSKYVDICYYSLTYLTYLCWIVHVTRAIMCIYHISGMCTKGIL